MKAPSCLLAFLVCFCAMAQQPSAPQNLTFEPTAAGDTNILYLSTITGTNNPLGLPHLGAAAYWQMPDPPRWATNYQGAYLTNIWIPETSYDNGVNWQISGNQTAYLPTRSDRTNGVWCLECWNFVEGPTNNPSWQVRIRRR